MKANVNKDICIGCGACQSITEGILEIGDDGLAEVSKEYQDKEIPKDKEEVLKDAIDSCPTSAIEEI